jgi:nucleoside permease NupC
MLETGLAVFIGLAFIFVKLRRTTMLRLLHRDMILDVAVTLVVLIIHWGTFSGVMAATVAGLLTSIGTSVAKRMVGYIRDDHYYPGVIHLAV